MSCTGDCRQHPHVKDMTSLVFGRLTVIRETKNPSKNRSRYWECICQCGNQKAVNGASLRSGETKSCGCYQRDKARKAGDRTRTHGMSSKSVYAIWNSMIQRCNNPKRKDYLKYGGRGISVCAEWMVFETFIADMGDRPMGMSLDRKDNNGNYEKSNCRWATTIEQARNQSTNRLITFQGVTQCMSEWAEVLHINKSTLQARFRYAWSVKKAFTKPIQKKINHA